MPMPLTTALLLAALALSHYQGVALTIITYVLVGLGCLNELLRALLTRPVDQVGRPGEYEIPSPLVRQRTPITYPGADDGGE